MRKIAFFVSVAALSLCAAPKLYTVDKGSGASAELSAVVYSKNESAVSTKIGGYIKKFYVEEGEAVKKGTLLFEVDAPSVEAGVISATANSAAAKAAYLDAKRDMERYKNLFEKGVVSEKEYERAKLNYEVKNQSYIAGQAFATQAKGEQGYSSVRAPMDGIVLKKYLTVASLANPGQPVLLFSGSGDLRIRADVYDSDVKNLKVGDTVKFKAQNIQKEAKILSITPSGANARGFMLRAEPKNTDGLYSGMFVKILPTQAVTNDSTAKIPLTVLTKRGGMTGAFAYQNGIAKFIPVKVKSSGGDFAVVEGVFFGAKLIENPKESLMDGQKAE